jgi:hypothetical protein
MGFNATNPGADTFHRGVINRSGGRGGVRAFQTVKDPPGTDGFVYPFTLPPTPVIPDVVIRRWVNEGNGGGVSTKPTYSAPTLSISGNPLSGEVGSLANVVVTPAWSQKDAGSATQYRISVDGTDIHSVATPGSFTITGFQFTDATKSIRGHVAYAAGAIKNDSDGIPYPTGAIPAGTINSNIINAVGFRKAFYAVSASPVATPTTPAQVRAYVDSLDNVASTKQIVVDVPTGTRDVVVAFPASVGNTINAVQQSLPAFPITAAFVKTIVNVEGAGGYTAVPYNVFHMSNASGYVSSDKITITITP